MDILQVLGLLVANNSELRTKLADFFWHPLTLVAIPLLAMAAACLAVGGGVR